MTLWIVISIAVALVALYLAFIFFRSRYERKRREELEKTLMESEKRVRDIFRDMQESQRELRESMKRISDLKLPDEPKK